MIEDSVEPSFSGPKTLVAEADHLRAVGYEGTFTLTVVVRGGGVPGQAEAVAHGVARALLKYDEQLRPTLRRGGYLTRDPRVKERKKPGLRRARKAKQYTKR